MRAEDRTLKEPGNREVTLSPTSRRGNLFDPACPTRKLLDRVGGKWTAMVVTVLDEDSPGEVRFAEMTRRIPGISKKMLAQTLRSLERDSLIERRVEATSPPRVHYRLTPLGASLTDPLARLREWAEANMSVIDEAGEEWDERTRTAG